MSAKTVLSVIVVVLVVTGSVAGWLDALGDYAATEREVSELQDTIEIREARVADLELELTTVRDSLADVRDVLDSLRAVAVAQADELTRTADSLSAVSFDLGVDFTEAVDALRDAAPPELVPMVDTVAERAERRDESRSREIQARTDEALELRGALGLAESTIGNLESELSVQDSLHAEITSNLRESLELTREQRDAWREEATPSFFGRLPQYLQGAAAGGLIVCALTCR